MRSDLDKVKEQLAKQKQQKEVFHSRAAIVHIHDYMTTKWIIIDNNKMGTRSHLCNQDRPCVRLSETLNLQQFQTYYSDQNTAVV